MVVVKAILIAAPGKEQELENKLKDIIPTVYKEKNTLTYTLHRAQNNPERFLFYEKYKDQQACDDHMNAVYLNDLLTHIKGLLCQTPEVDFFDEIGGFARTEPLGLAQK